MSMSSPRRRWARRQAKVRRNARRRRTRLRLESLEQRLLLTTLTGLDLDLQTCEGVDLPELEVTPLPDLTQPLDAATAAEIESATELAALNDTFTLHSNPDATKKIYLDFDGHLTRGTIWNTAFNSGNDIISTAYDFDGNGSAFSEAELQRIQYIWQRVAEDYIGFDVDVTTEDPGAAALTKSGGGDSEWGVRVVIGGSSYDWYGAGAGGVAYVGSFNWSTDSPAFVFEAQLGNGHEKYTAEAISHEVGHTLGLSHDGTSTTGYYKGQGSGETGWAPIMGVGYYQSLTQWSKGEYNDANQTQDDLAILTSQNGFGYRADDYGNTNSSAASLTSLDGSVSAYGIIERNTDADVFSFETGEGDIALSIDEFTRGANLDILAELFDATGTLITASNPASMLGASINTFVSAGTYYLRISGTGSGDPMTDGYTDYGSIGQYTINGQIVDPSTPPPPVVPEIAIDDVTVNEEDGTATFTVNLSEATTNEVSVNLATADGSALAGSDYLAKNQTLTFAAGQTSQTFSVSLVDDTHVETAESFMVNLSGAVNATIADAQGAATILDTDVPPPVIPAISINDVTVNEADGTASFNVNLSEATTNEVSVNLATADNSALAGADYMAKNQTLTFAAGEVSKSFTVSILDDADVESTESLLVNLSEAVNATLADSQGVGTILDDDVPPAVQPTISIADFTAAEGDVVRYGSYAGNSRIAIFTFNVSLSEASTQSVSVDYATADGLAVAGEDYIDASGTLVFAPGQTVQNVTVYVNGDLDGEVNENFFVNLSNVAGADIVDGEATGMILNDDGSVVTPPALSIGDAVVNEADGTATFTVNLSKTASSPVSVHLATSNDSARAGSDYVAKSQTLTFEAGETTKTFTVSIIDDSTVESNEAFRVNLSDASGATIADGQATGTIVDNDVPAPVPAISINDVSVNEFDGTATFTVTLSEATTNDVSVNLATADGSAEAGADYAAKSQTLTFAAGETSKTFTVSLIDDGMDETTESFVVNLADATGATIADHQGVGSILDDDQPQQNQPSIAIGDASSSEGDLVKYGRYAGNPRINYFMFDVMLSEASTETVTVDYTTLDGDALAGEDYNAASGTIVFAPGQLKQTITIQVIGDLEAEQDESFAVKLSNAIAATLDDDEGLGTIINDDSAGAPAEGRSAQSQMQAAWLAAQPMTSGASPFSAFLQRHDTADINDPVDRVLRDAV